MTDVWTAPTTVSAGPADVDVYNAETLANIRYLDQRDRARGIIAHLILNASESPHSVSGITDMVLDDVVIADATRAYMIYANSTMSFSAAGGSWACEVQANGSGIGRIAYEVDDWHASGGLLWLPSAGTYDISLYLAEASGAVTCNLAASATIVRQLWIEDVGPR